MLIEEAYLKSFEILNNLFYKMESKDDSLTSLLSDMDPKIFTDGKAADVATYNDWYDCAKKYERDGTLQGEEMLMALLDFLEYYQREFGFNFEQTIQYIKKLQFGMRRKV